MIVPDSEGTTHSLRISLVLLRILLVLIALLSVLFVILLVSWGRMYHQATRTEQLQAENDQFRNDLQHLTELEHRVDQLQHFEKQVRNALGADAISNIEDHVFASIVAAHSDTSSALFQPDSNPVTDTPLAVQSTSTASSDAEVYPGAEIPSLWPVDGFISREYEWNAVVPGRSHPGVDIAAKAGSVVKATAGGLVVWTGWSERYGNTVVLAHQSGYFSMYGHNQVILVKPRQQVQRGMPIALLGNTGQSSAPHLHFEIWLHELAINPLDMLVTY